MFVLVDVGSTGGIYPIFKKLLQYETEIHTFEPDKEGFDDDNNKKIINNNFGLFNEDGIMKLYITKKHDCSSLLKPNFMVLNKYYNPNRFSIEKVDNVIVTRFDNYFKGEHIDIIKLDTQGTEYEILEGFGESILRNTKMVITEAEFVELYEKQKLFSNLYKYLTDLNFSFLKCIRIVFASEKEYYEYNGGKNDSIRYNKDIISVKNTEYREEITNMIINRYKLINNILEQGNHVLDDIDNIKKITLNINNLDHLNILNNDELLFCDAIFINNTISDSNMEKY